MPDFSKEEYLLTLGEIRERVFSAEVLSKKRNVVFIESTALQIRKILELIAYLSVLVNIEKLNHREKNEWHPKKIIEALNIKTTIFYPFPSHMFPPQEADGQPVLIPFGYGCALSQSEFIDAYKKCGNILHAQHPMKEQLDIESFFLGNKNILTKIKALLKNHTIGIRHDANKYTFLYVEFDFTNNEDSRPTVIREYKTHIFNESELKELFST